MGKSKANKTTPIPAKYSNNIFAWFGDMIFIERKCTNPVGIPKETIITINPVMLLYKSISPCTCFPRCRPKRILVRNPRSVFTIWALKTLMIFFSILKNFSTGRHYNVNALAIRASCSSLCFFAKPVAVEALADRVK